jgi:hypothetical protein
VESSYSGGREDFASPWLQLKRLDRVLAQLTRPALPGSGPAPDVRADLIRQLWHCKRPLLGRLEALEDPMPPCA